MTAPELTKEEKKFINNCKYMGGSYPLHVNVIVEQNLCRIDFITAAHDTEYDIIAKTGSHSFAIIEKKYIPDVINALQKAYDFLK